MYKKYAGQWVGLDKDEVTVIAAGHTAKEVVQKSAKKGYLSPILHRVPDELVTFVGYEIRL